MLWEDAIYSKLKKGSLTMFCVITCVVRLCVVWKALSLNQSTSHIPKLFCKAKANYVSKGNMLWL